MEWLFDPQPWIALATLTLLEIVLGIDNIIFISILAGKLPRHQQQKARQIGLALAMLSRIGLLFTLSWFMHLTKPLFSVLTIEISFRDIVLIGGGLFLIGKSTLEIHEKLEGVEGASSVSVRATFPGVIVQIALLDIVFSLDSVITAVGLVDELAIMVIAIVIAVLFMMIFSKMVGEFVDCHPTIKMLALSFLLLIGLALIAEGFDIHIPKGYIYFAMAFSIFVEMLNLKLRAQKGEPLQLRKPYIQEIQEGADY